MSLENDSENESMSLMRVARLTKLIGLGEAERKIYEDILEANPKMRGNLKKAYGYHQKELDLLIKYRARVMRYKK